MGKKGIKGEPRSATTTICATEATKQTQPTLDHKPRVDWQSRPQNVQALREKLSSKLVIPVVFFLHNKYIEKDETDSKIAFI